jgi:hypothetical protein
MLYTVMIKVAIAYERVSNDQWLRVEILTVNNDNASASTVNPKDNPYAVNPSTTTASKSCTPLRASTGIGKGRTWLVDDIVYTIPVK